MSLRNRIVREGDIDPRLIQQHPNNWRTHPQFQQTVLLHVLKTIGWVDGVLINETTGNLLDGHLRVEEALKAGVSRIPAVWIAVSEEEEAALLLILDPLTGLAQYDEDALREQLAKAQSLSDEARRMLENLIAPAGTLVEAAQQKVEQAQQNAILNTTLQIGPYVFNLTIPQFKAWRDGIFAQVGMNKGDINAEILRRLGF